MNRPLNLSVPKPSFARSHSHTAFSFQAMAIPDTDFPQDTMSDDVDNAMDEGADIANEGKATNRGKLYMIHLSINAFTFFARTCRQHTAHYSRWKYWFVLINLYILI